MIRELRVKVSKRCLDVLQQVRRSEDGVNMVIVAFMLMVMLGFAGVAVDGGNAYYQQQRLQIAADAAALGGARLLALGASHDAVGVQIEAIAIKNSADSVQWTLINEGRGVDVVALRDVGTFFAKLYGYDEFSVSAQAKAQHEPVSAADDLFPMSIACDCVEDGILTLEADGPGTGGGEPVEETGPMTTTLDLDDSKDTSYSISYLGRTGNLWSYMVTEIEGRDLAYWGLGLESCLDAVESWDPGDGEVGAGGYDGIKWAVDGAFESGIFSFELNGEYPPNVVQAVAMSDNNKSLTAEIIGPDCSGGPIVEEVVAGPAGGMCLPNIDFETDDGGISLAAGAIIENQYEGWGVHVTTNDPANHPAMVFDSNNPTGGDWDLGASNEDFGGPGRGAGGRAGMPGENSRALGKLLIISEDGDSSDPDDNGSGGTMSFTFDAPVRVDEIHLVDVDDLDAVGDFKAYSTQDTSNLIAMGQSLGLGDNSFQVIPLNASNVRRLDITLPESGGIQSIVSCRSEPDILRTIGDLIWADTNGNGVQDADELGIPGIELELYLHGEDDVVATAVTDLNGGYAFRNLPPGGSAIYDVKVADSNFDTGRVLADVSFSPPDQGGDDALDSDFVFDSGSGSTLAIVTIGEEGGDNFDIDGGLIVDISEGVPTEAVLTLPATEGIVLPTQNCAADVAGFDLNCTANDVSLFSADNIIIYDDGCTSQEDTVSFSADFDVILTAQARHDLGIWFAEDGDPNGDGAYTGLCTVVTPATGPEPDFLDLDGDGDSCGDIDDAHNPLLPSITLTVKCVDADENGKLDLPYVTSWRQPGANERCESPLDAYPGTPSKCKSDTTFEVNIDVPPTETTPTGDGSCTTFRWLDWDGGSSSNMELKDDMIQTSRSGAWQVADIITSGPVMSSSGLIQSGLASKMGKNVVLALSDETENGNEVCGFGEVKLLSYTTANGKHFLSIEFLKDVVNSLGTDPTIPDYGARDVVVKQ